MATKAELSEKLLQRLSDVPNVALEDTDAWVDRSFLEHGLDEDEDVPRNQELLILLYAEWDACMQIALRSAYYFQYKDSEETVDKRDVSEQYRQIATEIWRVYDRKKKEGTNGTGGSRFRVMTRVDRP